jgi:hypothetical protein
LSRNHENETSEETNSDLTRGVHLAPGLCRGRGHLEPLSCGWWRAPPDRRSGEGDAQRSVAGSSDAVHAAGPTGGSDPQLSGRLRSFGLIEWHGRHLPLGNDALKAHAILVKVAEQSGGAVYPPVYFHEGWLGIAGAGPHRSFERLKQTGFWSFWVCQATMCRGQIDLINEALRPVVADGTVAGLGL